MSHSFAKSQRILSAAEFKPVFNEPGWRYSNKHILLLARSNALPQSRLGLVVSKKNAGCAVKRNRVKRLCREAFRLHPKDFATIDIVLLARPGISNLDNRAITNAVLGVLEKLRNAGTAARPPSAPVS